MARVSTVISVRLHHVSYLYSTSGSFSHSPEEVRERPNLTKTKMCPSIESNTSCPAPSFDLCPYAHSLTELRATPMLFRTVICSWWKKGQCEFGDSCRFAHGEDQRQFSCGSSSSHQGSPKSSLINGTTTAATPSSLSSLSNTYSNSSPAVPLAPAATLSSPLYPSVLAAALTAASQAAVKGGLTVLTSEQSMAIASAASAAAIEAVNRQQQLAAASSVAIVAQPPAQAIEAEINRQLRKGFASSPALLSFFEESSSPPSSSSSSSLVLRPRADSDPLVTNSQNILQELERLWINNDATAESVVGSPTLSVVGVPLMRSDPFLSASHMTLNDYQINID